MKKLMILSILVGVLLLTIGIITANNPGKKADSVKQSYVPKAGYVPDQATAIKIAEAIWLPIYGKEIYNEKPFKAKLIKGGTVWEVTGSLPNDMLVLGGTAIIEIRRSDCKILYVIHGK